MLNASQNLWIPKMSFKGISHTVLIISDRAAIAPKFPKFVLLFFFTSFLTLWKQTVGCDGIGGIIDLTHLSNVFWWCCKITMAKNSPYTEMYDLLSYCRTPCKPPGLWGLGDHLYHLNDWKLHITSSLLDDSRSLQCDEHFKTEHDASNHKDARLKADLHSAVKKNTVPYFLISPDWPSQKKIKLSRAIRRGTTFTEAFKCPQCGKTLNNTR